MEYWTSSGVAGQRSIISTNIAADSQLHLHALGDGKHSDGSLGRFRNVASFSGLRADPQNVNAVSFPWDFR